VVPPVGTPCPSNPLMPLIPCMPCMPLAADKSQYLLFCAGFNGGSFSGTSVIAIHEAP